jgi:hypothetical protein
LNNFTDHYIDNKTKKVAKTNDDGHTFLLRCSDILDGFVLARVPEINSFSNANLQTISMTIGKPPFSKRF